MKIKYSFLVFLFMQTLWSQTQVSGNQSGNWTLTNSPYQVTGNITIPAGQTLIIEAGVQVVFQDYYRIYVDGQLIANGNENNLIVFTPANQNTGWGGIRLDGTPDVSEFHYCKFEYGKTSATGSYPDMHGGAVVLKDADAQFYHCTFSHNDATGDDDGMGGAVYTMNSGSSTQTITKFIDCLFEYNHAYGEGGAIKFTNDGKTEITRCQFIGNSSNYGGGAIMYYTAYQTTLTQCLFYGNSAANSGGGALKSLNAQTSLTITNCTFTGNSANGAGEGGAADFDYADVTIVNSIFYNNNQTYGKDINIGQNTTVTINYCDVDMPFDATGDHNLNNVDPQFIDPAQGDFHLQAGSPCIDAGIAVGLPYNGAAPDLGCFESGTSSITATSDIPVTIYPNPANRYLHISLPEFKIFDIKVYNRPGQLLLRKNHITRKTTLDLKSLNPGIYTIIIENHENKVQKTFIKK